jgi:hypothetical protein
MKKKIVSLYPEFQEILEIYTKRYDELQDLYKKRNITKKELLFEILIASERYNASKENIITGQTMRVDKRPAPILHRD